MYDPYNQGGYQQQPGGPEVHHYYGASGNKTNGLAIAALVLGLVSFATCGLTAIPAIICGHLALGQIKRTGEQGQGMAMAGLIIGWAMSVLWLLYWVFIIFFGLAMPSSNF